MTKICILMRENEAKKSVQALMISKRKVSLRSYDQRAAKVRNGWELRNRLFGKPTGRHPSQAKAFLTYLCE